MSNDSFAEFNQLINKNDLCIFHQNIRSLRENFDSFCIYLDSLNKRPDIIVLTEIWVTDMELLSYMLEGYNQFARCNMTYRSGGVIVYVSEVFPSRSLSVNMTAADAIKITVDIGLGQFLSIIAVYRLHLYHVRDFLIQLKEILNSSIERNLVVVGDINLCFESI